MVSNYTVPGKNIKDKIWLVRAYNINIKDEHIMAVCDCEDSCVEYVKQCLEKESLHDHYFRWREESILDKELLKVK